jgi:hypothetical protein
MAVTIWGMRDPLAKGRTLGYPDHRSEALRWHNATKMTSVECRPGVEFRQERRVGPGTIKIPCYSERLDRALVMAAASFRTRVRKGSSIPYVTHLLQVMVTVAEHGGDEDQMIAALLHDYLEDIPGASREHLAEAFGEDVASMVERLSDSTGQPKPPWEPRKRRYLAGLRTETPRVKLISAADKLHNARSILRDFRTIGDEVFDRFAASREQTLWYYRQAVAALGEGWAHPLLDELREVVGTLHALAGEPMHEERSVGP